MTGRRATGCWSARVALLGIAVGMLVLLAAPFLRPELGLFEYALSYYAVGPWGAVQITGFAAMGVATLALAVALWQTELPAPWRAICVVALLVAGVASLALVWFPMGAPSPTTILGDAHQTAGTFGGVAQLVAALAFIFAARVHPAWSGLCVVALLLFALALAGAAATQLAIWRPDLGLPMGATMRLVVAPLLLLWGIVAWRLRRSACEPATRSCAAR